MNIKKKHCRLWIELDVGYSWQTWEKAKRVDELGLFKLVQRRYGKKEYSRGWRR